MPTDRLVAAVGAVVCAYGAVASIVFERLAYLGPCAGGFVVCLFAAELLAGQVQGDFLEVLHGSNFSAGEPHNTTQQIRGKL